MRKSTCYTRFYNTTAPPFTTACENPLAMDITHKLCCCTVGQGWLNPGKVNEPNSKPKCELCPLKGTGSIDMPVTTKNNYICW